MRIELGRLMLLKLDQAGVIGQFTQIAIHQNHLPAKSGRDMG
jgi:hypothetical protein